MMLLNGTHGTCVSCADSIKTSGFNLASSDGRAGKGAYFWAHGQHTEIARKLAVGWHGFANRLGKYSGYPNQGCAILWAEIVADKEKYLDFNDPEIEDALNTLVVQARAGGKENAPIDNDLLYKVHEYVIETVEQEYGCAIDVIRARVAPPMKMEFIEKIYVGNPNCYVVRNGFDRIKLIDVEHV